LKENRENWYNCTQAKKWGKKISRAVNGREREANAGGVAITNNKKKINYEGWIKKEKKERQMIIPQRKKTTKLRKKKPSAG